MTGVQTCALPIYADEYYEFYLKKLGLPQYLATGFINAYDKNGDGAEIGRASCRERV